MALVDQLFISGSWTSTALILTNLTGTPLVSAVVNPSGEALADLYTLDISVRTGGTCTVTVNTGSPNNPRKGDVFTLQPCDGTTVIDYIVPGAHIVLDTDAANGDEVTIELGTPYGTFDASGVDAGVPTTGIQHRVLNSGSAGVISAAVKFFTQAVMVSITNRPLVYVLPFARNATEKIAGSGSYRVMPYAFTFAGVTGSGPTKTATLAIDGVLATAIILDVATGDTVDGTSLKAIDTYAYRFLSGPLQDVEFAIAANVANGDKSNVLIFSSRYIQAAPDVAGSEGAYGTADVTLTEAGQADGVITASGVAYYWTRFLVPGSADSESNPYPTRLAISGSQSGGAGWEE